MSERQRFGDKVAVRRYEHVHGGLTGRTEVRRQHRPVVVDGEQHELELEVEGDANAFISNGVLTVEVDA